MSLNILEINKIISEVWQKAEVLKSLTRREAKEETEKMASKKKMVAFKYDSTKPDQMDQVYVEWARTNPEIILPGIFEAWAKGSIQLLLPKSTAMKLISNWEVI